VTLVDNRKSIWPPKPEMLLSLELTGAIEILAANLGPLMEEAVSRLLILGTMPEMAM